MAAAVTAAPGGAGSGLRLGAVRGRKPAFEEDDVQRIREVLAEVCAELGTPHVCPCAAANEDLRGVSSEAARWFPDKSLALCPSLPF